jgi:hypothetical protein
MASADSSAERQPIHPLFHRDSLFRTIVAESTFEDDNGEQSIRDFFLAQHRADLYYQWGPQSPSFPDAVQPWGLGTIVDEGIHQFLHAQAAPQEKSPQRSSHHLVPLGGEVTFASRDEEPTPALLLYRFDVHGDAVAPTPDRSRGEAAPFPGCGELSLSARRRDFWVKVGGLPDDHVCLMLILNRGAVRVLKTLVESPEPQPHTTISPSTLASEGDAIATITRALRRENLAANAPGGHALELSTQLALSPAVQGMTSDGKFDFEVELDRDCPMLSEWTWVVLCVGPRPTYRGAGVSR